MNASRNLVPCALAALAFLSFVPSSAAQDHLASLLDGLQETPPNPSTAVGRGWATLDPLTLQLWYRVESDVVGGTMAHIHQGGPGVPGPIIFPLAGGPAVYQGATPPLSAAQMITLFQGNYYFNIHTVAFGGGEIRGQIRPAFRRTQLATLDGGQAGTASLGTGSATVWVRIPENVVSVRLTAAGLGAAVLDAELHTGAPGPPGPLVFALSGTGPAWSGTFGPFSTATINAIVAGNAYLTIHTAAFPAGNGEIRGQLKPTVEVFDAHLNGAEEVPANASPQTGFGRYQFDPATNTLAYNTTWTGATGTMAHVHVGVPRLNGGIIIPMAGPPNGPYVGVSGAMAAANITALFATGLYSNIHTVALPNGEIRGQLKQNPDVYGWAGPTSAGVLGRVLRIHNVGQPTIGNPAFGVAVTDAVPGSVVALGNAPNLIGAPFDIAFMGATGHVLWEIPLSGFTTAADATGFASLSFAIPTVPAFAGAQFYWQWVGIEIGANPLSIVTSDALRTALY